MDESMDEESAMTQTDAGSREHAMPANAAGGVSSTGRGAGSGSGADMNAIGDRAGRPVTITVVSAGVSEPSTTSRLGDAVALQTAEYLRAQGRDVRVRRIDLRDFAQDIAIASVSGHASQTLQQAIDKVKASDGVVAASPIFKASYSGLFKSFWDIMDPDAIVDMPVALTATGGSERHALMTDTDMRSLFAFMRAIAAPTSLVAATKDWAGEALSSREQRVGAELGALIESDVRNVVLRAAGSYYRRSFSADRAAAGEPTGASDAGEDGSSGAEDGLDFDSALMRLAAGGMAAGRRDGDA